MLIEIHLLNNDDWSFIQERKFESSMVVIGIETNDNSGMPWWRFGNKPKTTSLPNEAIEEDTHSEILSKDKSQQVNSGQDLDFKSKLDSGDTEVALAEIQNSSKEEFGEDYLESNEISKSEPQLNENTEEHSKSNNDIPEYPIGKELRQGPWFHPFPLIVGVSIFGLVIALFAANLQINQLQNELDKTDYFHYPPNLSQLITKVQKSTMVVKCGDSLGSGWVIALGEVIDTASEATKRLDKAYPGSVVTNYHVISACVDNPKGVTTSNGGEYFDSVLFSYDRENDLALVSTKLVLPALEISMKPSPGWWSMALGSPYGIEKSISIGNIMNVVDKEIISTAPINPGNSGGPLVNSFGEVIGTNTWKLLGGASGINVARSVSLLCVKLVVCTNEIWQ